MNVPVVSLPAPPRPDGGTSHVLGSSKSDIFDCDDFSGSDAVAGIGGDGRRSAAGGQRRSAG